MEDTTTTADKRIAEQLNYGAKTAKRVTWEAWEFSIEAPHLVRVTNASYGCEKDDHSYLVGVEDRDGLLVPAECECPADMYNEEYDCKHKLALATIGGPLVLRAAVDLPTPGVKDRKTTSNTLKDKLRADGGEISEESREDSASVIGDEREECDCAELPDDFPCWPCVRDGLRQVPE